jgi:polyhydroxyalkanoate synthesis repressor PhaR
MGEMLESGARVVKRYVQCDRNCAALREWALLIKKYGNRRLYDTVRSRYITLEELADIVRREDGVRVVDAKTGEDLTTSTLAQIIVEGRGAARLLPLPLLVQLIRMGDDALAEFLGQYVTWALEVYLQARQGVQAMAPFNPFAALSYRPGAGLSRMFGMGPPQPPEPASRPPPAAAPAAEGEVAALRREMEELKKSLKKRRH